MPMVPDGTPLGWVVIEVDRPREEWRKDVIVDLLAAISGRGVEEDETLLRGYLAAREPDDQTLVASVRDLILAALPDNAPDTRFGWQPHEDWVALWRQGVRPRRVGARIVVVPSWEEHELAENDIVIRLDPGVAFGTAEHATTRGCLRLLERFVRDGDRVGDFGSGSGILAIAAVRLGAGSVLAVDSDPLAHGTAVENARENGVQERLTICEEFVDAAFLRREGPFDGIVANIEAGVLAPLMGHLRGALFGEGWLILSGMQTEEAARMIDLAGAAGLALRASDAEPGWWTGAFSSI